MIVVVDLITWKEAIELEHVKINILLEYLFELSNKSKTFYKRCNYKDIITDGSPCASSMTRNTGPNEGKVVTAKRTVSKASPFRPPLLQHAIF